MIQWAIFNSLNSEKMHNLNYLKEIPIKIGGKKELFDYCELNKLSNVSILPYKQVNTKFVKV